MLERIRRTFSIVDRTYSWFRSYLTGRTQSVRATVTSHAGLLQLAVASIKAPSYRGNSVHPQYGCSTVSQPTSRAHIWVPMTLKPTVRADVNCLTARIANCADDVSRWMSTHRLQLYVGKTKLLWHSTARGANRLPDGRMSFDRHSDNVSTSVRDLGNHLDADLSLRRYARTTKVGPLIRLYSRSPDVGEDAVAHASGLREHRALWTSGFAAAPTSIRATRSCPDYFWLRRADHTDIRSDSSSLAPRAGAHPVQTGWAHIASAKPQCAAILVYIRSRFRSAKMSRSALCWQSAAGRPRACLAKNRWSRVPGAWLASAFETVYRLMSPHPLLLASSESDLKHLFGISFPGAVVHCCWLSLSCHSAVCLRP